jgi:putative CocE/NonD family hydrolase
VSTKTSAYLGSAITHDVALEEVSVPTRDGLRLATSIYRPAIDGTPVETQFPTILERTPYNRGRLDLHIMGNYFATRGYNVAIQDCRGRYDSEGEFTFFVRSHEDEDGYDTVEWLAQQEWSDGQIGTTGLSFAGANQQALAVLRPPHLTTQIILDAGYNYWFRTLRNSGAVHDGLILPYAFWMALGSKEAAADASIRAALRDVLQNIESWLRQLPLKRGASPLALVPGYEAWYFDLVTTGDYTDFWRHPMPSFQEHVEKYPDIPVCLVTSWYGLHTWATFEKFNALQRQNSQPVHAVAGIWLHGFDYMQQTWAGETDFGNAACDNLNDFRLRWFDRWLKGMPARDEDSRPIRLFVMGGGTGKRNLAGRLSHGGRWREEDEWPLQRTDWTDLYLQPDGTLSDAPPEAAESSTTYTFDPSDPVPTIGGHCMDPLGGERGILYGGGFDQRGRADLIMCRDTLPLANRPDVLVFRTPPLTEELEVTGPISVRLWVASTGHDTDFTARLIDEYPPSEDYPAGYALNLSDSITRMRYRNGATEAELIEPGAVYEITVDPLPTSNVFARGHRIRLDISSSSSPQFDVNPNTGGPLGEGHGGLVVRNTVFHDSQRPSHVRLAVIPPVEAEA